MAKSRRIKTIDERIEEIRSTIEKLKEEVPPEGEAWRDGMIKYYTRVLNELLEMKTKQRM